MKHRQPLAEIPFTDVRIGDEVISHVGNPGVVITKVLEGEDYHMDRFSCPYRYDMIVIRWIHGGVSIQPHFLLDYVVTK